jgi:hypothetical protein
MLENFHLSTFTPYLNTLFRVATGADQFVPMELIQAGDLGSTARQERFSVVFRGPIAAFLPQQLLPMEHDALGAFSLFLVPIVRDEGGYLYEAVFNRLVQP